MTIHLLRDHILASKLKSDNSYIEGIATICFVQVE